jgi:hypothetical protein
VYAVICLRAHYKYYLSTNIQDNVFKSKNKSRPAVHKEVQNIVSEVLQFFPQEKSNGNFKYSIENAETCATADTGKSETHYAKYEKK